MSVNFDDNRMINVDKTLTRGNIQFVHKPLKINENEKQALGLNSREMDLLVLKYNDDNGGKREFIIGNIINSRNEGNSKKLAKQIHNVNRIIEYLNLKSETAQYRCRRLNEEISEVKQVFEKDFGIDYVPEGYDFFYGREGYNLEDEVYNAKSTVIINSNDGVSNLVISDEVSSKDLFKNKSYFENKIVTQQSILMDDQVVTTEIRKDIDEVRGYLGKVIESTDALIEFFRGNPNILNDVAEKDPAIRSSLENWKQGKTIVDDFMAASIVFKAGVQYIAKDTELLEKVNMPDEVSITKQENEEKVVENREDDLVI